MSNKPKIHATCKAGCLWETVHKDDFDASASHIKQYIDESGKAFLIVDKEYKIFSSKDENNQFTCNVIFSYNDNGVTKTHTITHENEDKYAESFVFRLLEASVSADATSITIVYEIAGIRYAETISGTKLSLIAENYIHVFGATKVLQYNANAQIIGTAGEVDTTLTKEGEPADAKATGERLAALEEAINYKAIDLTSFTALPSTAEKGSTVSVSLSWAINKAPTKQTLNGSTLGNTVRSKSFTGIKADTTYTLIATDEKGATDTSSAYVKFYNGVYYGVSASAETYDSNFILALTKSLQGSKAKTFTVTADANQYIYYALPSSYITDNNPIVFNVGGFDGGFGKVATISFTNANNHTESYDIYRSDNANLGYTTVKVS